MVLVAALLALALLSVLCLAGISTSTLEVKISAHDRDAKQAFYLCEAGFEKAKLEILKGWGRGVGAGSPGSYTLDFDAATLPAAATTLMTTTDNKWVSFTLGDSRGNQYLVTASEGTSPYHLALTLASGSAAVPRGDRTKLYYRGQPLEAAGFGSSIAANELTAASVTWTTDQWKGYYLLDDANNVFSIEGNSTNVLTLNGTPANGNFQIRNHLSGVNTFTLAPGVPNALWTDADFDGGLWFLRDAGGNLFHITSADPSTGRIVLHLAGPTGVTTPADGAYQLVTNPWLVAPPADMTYDATDFPSPSGTDYGSVTVTLTPSTATRGLYTLRSESTSAGSGDAKALEADAQLQPQGGVMISNWRQVR